MYFAFLTVYVTHLLSVSMFANCSGIVLNNDAMVSGIDVLCVIPFVIEPSILYTAMFFMSAVFSLATAVATHL